MWFLSIGKLAAVIRFRGEGGSYRWRRGVSATLEMALIPVQRRGWRIANMMAPVGSTAVQTLGLGSPLEGTLMCKHASQFLPLCDGSSDPNAFRQPRD